MSGNYRVRIRQGEFEVEVESTDREFVDVKLHEYVQEKGLSLRSPVTKKAETSKQTGKPMTMQEFVRKVKPQSGNDAVLAIAYFREKFEGVQEMKTQQIKDGLRAIKYDLKNASDSVSQLKSQGLLMQGSETRAFMVSGTGEQRIEKRLEEIGGED